MAHTISVNAVPIFWRNVYFLLFYSYNFQWIFILNFFIKPKKEQEFIYKNILILESKPEV